LLIAKPIDPFNTFSISSLLDYLREKSSDPKLKNLSVHSGSDKFSIYPVIHETLERTGAGVHLKTAGTTWLEELIRLAESGGEGLALAKEIYSEAYSHQAELCDPTRA
jgi:tagaturonate epimerase